MVNSMEPISSLSIVEEAGILNNAQRQMIEQPLPRELGTCALIPDFLSRAECNALIRAAEGRGFSSAEMDYPPSYRNNERQVLTDQQLAARLQCRLSEALSGGIERLLSSDLTPNWRLESINERFRLCRYQSGQRFHIHQDGVHHRGPNCRSMLTFMVYLADGDDFDGGDTLFYAAGPRAGEGGSNLVARVRPRAGSLIVFDHSIWHAGEEVTRGVKYVLRSDILFRRTSEAPAPVSHHQGYIWTLVELDDGRVASGGRDGSIRIWHDDGELDGTLIGHNQSVLGLVEVHPGVIASISRDRTLRHWDIAEQRCIRSVTAHTAAILSIARTSEQTVATGSADHTIRLWSEDCTLIRSLKGHDGWVWGLVNIGQDLLASASEDGSVRIWNLGSGQCIATFRTSCPLRTIDAYQPDLANNMLYLAVGDASGRTTSLSASLSNIRELASFKAHDAAVRRARFLHNGTLATCGEDNRLRIWSNDSSELIHEEVHGNFVTDVIELRDGSRVSCGYDGALRWR
jgi:predicted 2-oxoglutarate/Fe(II)-dependent dioxygenase YbiX